MALSCPDAVMGSRCECAITARRHPRPTPYAALRELLSEVNLPESNHTPLFFCGRFEL